MQVFRHLLAPPISQDQFKLICSDWPKSSEKSGKSVAIAKAQRIATVLREWRSPYVGSWVEGDRQPTPDEVEHLLTSIAPLIASQIVATARRNRLARIQEEDVIKLLDGMGWTKLPSGAIDKQGALTEKQFMHKARFASGK